MPILARYILRVGIVGFDPPRFWRCWWPPPLALRDAPLLALASAQPNLGSISHLDHRSGSIYKPWTPVQFAFETTKYKDIDNMRTKATKESTEYHPTEDRMYTTSPLENSSHRDGAVYKSNIVDECLLIGDIADRNETRLEPMMFSKVTRHCLPDPKHCTYHLPERIIQIFSVRLSKSPISNASTQVYGYIAVRDERDGMLNYVVNYSRDDPIVVQQGSLIEMTGPKRCISLETFVLIEFDMRIKNGLHEDDDLQLIDGVIVCSYRTYGAWKPFIDRLTGDSGAVDLYLATIAAAVEATIEVVISQVVSGLNLSLSSFVDVMDVYEEIQLFHGKIGQPGALRRFVVAVPWDTMMLLKFKVGNDVEHSRHGCATEQIEFQAWPHGCAIRHIKLKLATISVKVTWSTI